MPKILTRGVDTRRVLVVTGSPRSGTTAVGDTLAMAPGVMSLYEPLNATVGDRRVGRYFEVPGSPELPVEDARRLADDVVRLRLRLRPGIFKRDPAWRKVVKRVTGSRALASYRRARMNPEPILIWKDPFAIFWLKQLSQDLPDFAAVVTHRPVLAVAASFARLSWKFDVVSLLARLEAAGELVPPDVVRFVHDNDMRNPALNGAATWGIVYGWYLHADVPNGTLVDAKDMTSTPGAYRQLYERVGLPFTAEVERRIAAEQQRQSSEKAADFGSRAHTKHRNLANMNSYYTGVLSEEDQERIRAGLSRVQEDVRAAIWHPTALSTL
jgi:hypothetical protein